MKRHIQQLIILTSTLFLLTACFGPKTPQEVTQAFWEAVIANDADAVTKYSTLTAPKNYDGFSKEWSGFTVKLGKIEIDGTKAIIVSKLTRQTESGKEQRKFSTHLVKRNEAWLVNYESTAEEVRGGILGNLFGQLSKMGDDLSRQFQASANEFKAEMDRVGKELEERSDAIADETSANLDRFAEALRKSIKELEDSINQALKEKEKELSDKDRNKLREVVASLEQDSEKLENPTIESLAEGSKGIGRAHYELGSIDNNSVTDYKQKWQELAQHFEHETQALLDDLSSSNDSSR